MDYRFCCYGQFCKTNFKCLIKCPDKKECEVETSLRKIIKYDLKKGKEEDGEDNKG